MKFSVAHFQNAYPRAYHWVSACLRLGSVQVIVQACGLVSGFLLIRCLTKEQYAWFTITGVMQGALSLLADNGVGWALMAEGGKVFQDRVAFGRLINSAFSVRRWLAAIAAPIVIPALFYLLRRANAPLWLTLLLIATVATTFHFSLKAGVLNVVPRLRGHITQLQNLDLLPTLGRLASFLALAAAHLLDVASASLVAAGAACAQYFLLRSWTAADIDIHAPSSAAERKAILKVVKQVTANTIFYCVQGQLSVWLIATFSTADKIAEIGALGRLAVVFGVIGSVVNNVITPAFARCREKRKLLRTYFYVLAGFFALCCGLMLVAFVFPHQILWVLGKRYANLQHEFYLMVFLTLSNAFIATMYSLNSSRAWMDVAWIEIPMRITLQIVLVSTLDISSVSGVLWLSIWSNLSPLLINIILSFRGFRSVPATVLPGEPAIT